MSFLTPLFFIALAGAAVPVIIHLIQKERKNVVAFPSLMFLRRIPYQSVQRRRIRNWPLLLLRIAALALIVMAFTRPFVRRDALAAAAAGGAREVVILLDRSYSVTYANRWERGVEAARTAIGGLNNGDRASVVVFDTGAEVLLRSTGDKGRLTAALDAAKPGAAATKFGPALKLAGSILSESGLPNREVVLISDYQRRGWAGAEGVRLPDGTKVTTVPLDAQGGGNVSVTPAVLQRTSFADQERITVTAGALNRAAQPATATLTLEVDGRAVESKPLALAANGAAAVTFTPFVPSSKFTRGSVRLPDDGLAADNTFHFVVTPSERVKLVIVERPGVPRAASLYMAQALSLSERPVFDVARRTIDNVSAEDISSAGVIVLNDTPIAQLTAERLQKFVERGGGLFMAFGERAAWPAGVADIMPVVPGATADRTRGTPGRIGSVDFGHPVFESFKAPRSGDFSVARFYNYRTVTPAAGAQILARYDDGAPALVERRVGQGRVLAWTSTLDVTWNDLALKPVFLPFIHRVTATLAAYTQRPDAMKVGEVVGTRAAGLVLTPSGRRQTIETGAAVELQEQGFYELRAGERDENPVTVAANVDLTESDLSAMAAEEVAAGATGRAGGAAPSGSNTVVTNEERERTQRVWWYVLFAGLLLLGAESFVSNRIRTLYV